MADAVRRIASREVYRNPWLALREDVVRRGDGSTGIFSVIDKPDFALVIAVDGADVHLVEQFRYPVGVRCLEFPQGATTETAEPLEVAQQELAEETGLRAAEWSHLGRLFTAYGFCSQSYDVWLASDLTAGANALEVTEQDLRHVVVRRAELDAMVGDGRIADAHSVAAYALLLRHERDHG